MTKTRSLLPLLLLAACATDSAISTSRDYARVGDHRRAFMVLDEERGREIARGDTPSAELEDAHHKARVAMLLQRARENIFEEREDLALADLQTLRRLVADDSQVEELNDRALRKKAMRSVLLGNDCILRKDLQAAMTHYLTALRVMPDFPPAIEGSDRVRDAMGRLSERAQQQFLEAVRKLPEFRYVEVRWHADIAVSNDPQRNDADIIRLRALREIANRALDRGRDCQQKDQFGAALLEFRTARKLDPTLPGIDDLVAQSEREVEASALIERAQRSMRSSQFDIAREQLAKALALSSLSKTAITELMVQAKRLEGESKYQAARDLEVLGKKAEALAAFEAVAKEWPDGLLDEQGRIEGLRVDIEGAKTEWAAAEAAEKANDPVQALLHYETAMQYYPGWKDGPQRVERLRQKVAPKPVNGPSGQPSVQPKK